MGADTELLKKPAPTLYGILALKLGKGALLVVLALTAYTLSDNDLPDEFRHRLRLLYFDPAKRFFLELAAQLSGVTEQTALRVGYPLRPQEDRRCPAQPFKSPHSRSRLRSY